ncbi:MAG: T9SS type A sorting domain-containing protein [Flavobacterium sp.]|nr:T9SS type A sorting domain-containing protein [Flavobacterium sp.]
MFKTLIIILLFMLVSFGFSQNNSQWQGYFSYNKIVDLSVSIENIYAGSENSVFTKNLSSNEIKTINSIDGLKMQNVSSIYHSESSNKTLIGNKNGLLLVINQDGTILFKNGILAELPVSPFIKKINHFYEYQGKIYISADYGITVFDLETLEFGDTYYIGNAGQQTKIYQTTVFNNEIYAVTDNFGIKKVSLSNPNIIDYNQWTVFNSSSWSGIVTFQNQLIASDVNASVSKFVGTVPSPILNMSLTAIDIRSNENYIIVTNQNEVYVLNGSLQQVAHVVKNQITAISVTFTCATEINNILYIGTNENGIVTTSLQSSSSFEFILPNGPQNNSIFRLNKTSKALWAVYGGYNKEYNPYAPNGLGVFPISKYTPENGWSIIPYSSLFGAKSLSNIAFNPNNENQFYVSSFFSGLLKVDNEIPTILYNSTNTGTTGLESLILSPPNPAYVDVRINGATFDKNNNIWVTNSLTAKGLKVLKAGGQWQQFDFTNLLSDAKNESYPLMVIDRNNTKWIATAHNGLLAFNETQNNKHIVVFTGTNGNLPDQDVRCVAIDTKNQLWIGTTKGLRIIPSVDSFLSETELQSKAIIILENDLAQELFYDQFIIDIAVDGANRKWVSTADGGVFLVSPNGQETIYHFTTDNSPLPSNTINDIEIDGITGEVFFATNNGLVSFKGSATRASESLENVFCYPNPVRPEYQGTVKISGLTNKAVVKITDIEGNLVYEVTSEGGTMEWDTTAFNKYRVASGVYLVLISAQDGIDTTVKKVMIIR